MARLLPFPLLAERPSALEGVILDFHWDLERLHALALPEREVPTSTLRWHLELPFWAAGGLPFQVSPAEVAADPEKHPHQWKRTLDADLTYALDTYVGEKGDLIILDGVHRLLKADVEGPPTVRVRAMEPDQFSAIAVQADA